MKWEINSNNYDMQDGSTPDTCFSIPTEEPVYSV